MERNMATQSNNAVASEVSSGGGTRQYMYFAVTTIGSYSSFEILLRAEEYAAIILCRYICARLSIFEDGDIACECAAVMLRMA